MRSSRSEWRAMAFDVGPEPLTLFGPWVGDRNLAVDRAKLIRRGYGRQAIRLEHRVVTIQAMPDEEIDPR